MNISCLECLVVMKFCRLLRMLVICGWYLLKIWVSFCSLLCRLVLVVVCRCSILLFFSRFFNRLLKVVMFLLSMKVVFVLMLLEVRNLLELWFRCRVSIISWLVVVILCVVGWFCDCSMVICLFRFSIMGSSWLRCLSVVLKLVNFFFMLRMVLVVRLV